MSNMTNQLNDEFLAAIGFDFVFNDIGLNNIDEHEALFLMGNEL